MAEFGHFKSGNNELAYSYAVPSEKAEKTGIIFVHAADSNRLGPHRMFVEMAASFNSLGYPTLRFDLSGCGDSTGVVVKGDGLAQLLDVVEAVHFFTNIAKIKNVVLFGISRGSYLCYHAMAQHVLPLSGMILLSIPYSSDRTALKSFSNILKEYILKLHDPTRFRNLLSGKANPRGILRTFCKSLGLRNRYSANRQHGFLSTCPTLFIYGSKDPIMHESIKFYTEKYRGNDIPYTCHIIPHANHSFFHYKWKEEIFAVSKRWLSENR